VKGETISMECTSTIYFQQFSNPSKTIYSPKSNSCKLLRLPISDGIEEIWLLSEWTQEELMIVYAAMDRLVRSERRNNFHGMFQHNLIPVVFKSFQHHTLTQIQCLQARHITNP
jgi:hypothetical protein